MMDQTRNSTTVCTVARYALGTSTCTNDHDSGTVSAVVHRNRLLYLDGLKSLGATVSEDTRAHYLSRLALAGDEPMAGEYVPLFLCDLLHLPSIAAGSIAVPWLEMYAYALALDDSIDKTKQTSLKRAQYGRIAGALLGRCFSTWKDRLEAYPDLINLFHMYREQSMMAVYEETNRLHLTSTIKSVQSLCSDEHIRSGRKSALLKFCAAALSVEYRGRLLLPIEEAGLDEFCAAVQIFDDVADIGEDCDEGRMSYPLRVANTELRWRFGKCLDKENLDAESGIAAFIFSGVAKEVFTVASSYLQSAFLKLNVPNNTTVSDYALFLETEAVGASARIDTVLSQKRPMVEKVANALARGEFANTIEKEPYRSLWRDVRNEFIAMARARN